MSIYIYMVLVVAKLFFYFFIQKCTIAYQLVSSCGELYDLSSDTKLESILQVLTKVYTFP